MSTGTIESFSSESNHHPHLPSNRTVRPTLILLPSLLTSINKYPSQTLTLFSLTHECLTVSPEYPFQQNS